MRHALTVPLSLALLSPMLWAGLMTWAATLQLGTALIVGAVWLWCSARRGDAGRQISLHLATVFGAALLWCSGATLWLRIPEAAWWHGIYVAAMGAVLLSGLLLPPAPRGGAIPPTARAVLWMCIGVWTLMTLGDSSEFRWPVVAAVVPILLLPWLLPRCTAAVASRLPSLAVAVAVGALVIAGGVQAWRVRGEFSRVSRDPEPWRLDWRPEEIDALRARFGRFPQSGDAALVQSLRGLAALRSGNTTEAMALAVGALEAGGDQPAIVAAACRTLGLQGELEALAGRVQPSQVVASDSLEAGRHLTGAFIAADDFGSAQLVHAHFGDFLFLRDHPVLTPQRIGTALVAWGRHDDALWWFDHYPPPVEQAAESLFWRGIAQASLGRQTEAREAWETAILIAPEHADARSHLEGGSDTFRVARDLLPHPVAGRQLVEVTVTPVSPDTLADPLILEPGQIFDLTTGWRLTHVTTDSMDVNLRVGGHEVPLLRLGGTEEIVERGTRLHLGEHVRHRARATIPNAVAPAVKVVDLVVATGPGAPVPTEAVTTLAPLAAHAGFRRLNPRDSRAGISAANRHRLFGADSIALGVGAGLTGPESAHLEVDPPRPAQRLGIISYLSGARQIAEGQVAAQVLISNQHGPPVAYPLVTGRDLSDVWYDYPPFEGQILHDMARIAWQMDRPHPEHSFHNSFFLTVVELGEGMDVNAIKLRSLLPPGVAIHVVDMVLAPG